MAGTARQSGAPLDEIEAAKILRMNGHTLCPIRPFA